jgi:hypothetical protein
MGTNDVTAKLNLKIINVLVVLQANFAIQNVIVIFYVKISS